MKRRDIRHGDAGREAWRLLQTGQFDAARAAFGELARRAPMNRRVHHALAALIARAGRPQEAHALLHDFFTRCPVDPRSHEDGTEYRRVVRIRGFGGTRPILKTDGNGRYRPSFRGGHFTLRYLLARRDFAMVTYTVVAGSRIDPATMPRHALLINSIADPDSEGGSLKSLEGYLTGTGARNVINRPENVWQTARDRNYQRLRDFRDLTFPRTVRGRFENAGPEEVEAWLRREGFALPVILRRSGTQTGRTTRLIETREALRALCKGGLSGEFYAIAFHNLRWRGSHYRKLRLFWIDGAFHPVVCHIDRVWNVHGGNRKTEMLGNRELMNEEMRFLDNWPDYVGARNADTLHRVAEATGLEFFGVDFDLDEDGRLFVFELNPAMRHSFDHARAFPYKRPHDEAVTEAFTRMVESRLARPGAGG
ncbi:MAG: hypothetical protein D6754_01775 [Alphaproteobacteria bacterium]|nr:MAG: hypothetical protein D6754_01775 [Alphaproteobacteria bacterium]